MLKRLLALVGALFLLALAGGALWWHFTDEVAHSRLLEKAGLRQSPLAVATSSLDVIEARRDLTVQVARFNTKQVSRHDLVSAVPIDLLATTKTLIINGSVRYMLDLAALTPQSLAYDAATRTLTVRRPQLKIAEPELHVTDMTALKDGGMIMWLSGTEPELDRQNYQKAIQQFKAAAQASKLVESATTTADTALTDLFRLPLTAAGYGDVQVKISG